MKFLGSTKESEHGRAVAAPLPLGGSTHVWDVGVHSDAKDRTIAAIRCTQMVLHPR